MFKFKKTEETINKTFRYPKILIEKMSVTAQKEGISLNSFVVQCCEYVMDNIDEQSPKADD